MFLAGTDVTDLGSGTVMRVDRDYLSPARPSREEQRWESGVALPGPEALVLPPQRAPLLQMPSADSNLAFQQSVFCEEGP